MHLSLYNEVIVFDQATKIAYTCVWLHLEDYQSPEQAFLSGKRRLRAMNDRLSKVPALDHAKVQNVTHQILLSTTFHPLTQKLPELYHCMRMVLLSCIMCS